MAVVTGDVPMGATPEQALEGVRLLMLANDVSLRNLIPDELAKGFGFFQSKPATAFSPVAVTPDELGDAWEGGRVHLVLQSSWNGRKVGMCDAGPEMTFHFGQLIAHICKTRNVRAGSIVGSGTVSNKGVTGAGGKTEWPKGYSCIAEKRAIETIQDGKPSTEFMTFGDTIRIEMKGKDGQSLFGAIEQKVVRPQAADQPRAGTLRPMRAPINNGWCANGVPDEQNEVIHRGLPARADGRPGGPGDRQGVARPGRGRGRALERTRCDRHRDAVGGSPRRT